MHHSELIHGGNSVAGLHDIGERFSQRQRPAHADDLREVWAIRMLGDHVRRPEFKHSDVDHTRHMLVSDLGEAARARQKIPNGVRKCACFRAQVLQRCRFIEN